MLQNKIEYPLPTLTGNERAQVVLLAAMDRQVMGKDLEKLITDFLNRYETDTALIELMSKGLVRPIVKRGQLAFEKTGRK